MCFSLTNFEQLLLQVLKKYGLERLYLGKSSTANSSEGGGSSGGQDGQPGWNELSMLTKLDIIYQLCEVRLQLPDIESKLSDYEAGELRVEPLGVDSDGNKLWYFGDLRLYEEK